MFTCPVLLSSNSLHTRTGHLRAPDYALHFTRCSFIRIDDDSDAPSGSFKLTSGIPNCPPRISQPGYRILYVPDLAYHYALREGYPELVPYTGFVSCRGSDTGSVVRNHRGRVSGSEASVVACSLRTCTSMFGRVVRKQSAVCSSPELTSGHYGLAWLSTQSTPVRVPGASLVIVYHSLADAKSVCPSCSLSSGTSLARAHVGAYGRMRTARRAATGRRQIPRTYGRRFKFLATSLEPASATRAQDLLTAPECEKPCIRRVQHHTPGVPCDDVHAHAAAACFDSSLLGHPSSALSSRTRPLPRGSTNYVYH
ncbi:hypothetical protein GY45DRAFT_512608 [Cubamyces sp. BRFM 1775]|nr:hypothetical protein GY45DRAFT_512608 [Cubamyces sp. BRFM 1775]